MYFLSRILIAYFGSSARISPLFMRSCKTHVVGIKFRQMSNSKLDERVVEAENVSTDRTRRCCGCAVAFLSALFYLQNLSHGGAWY